MHSRAEGVAYLVALNLAIHADARGEVVLTVARLMVMCRCSKSSVKRGLESLCRAGEIEQITAGNGRGIASAYRLVFESKGVH